MKTALVPGSFDPPTSGHLAVIETAANLFDKVIVTVMENSEKKYVFSPPERVNMLRKITNGMKNVVVDYDSGMLWKYAKDNAVDIIIKGIRGKDDLDYESGMAYFNFKNCGVRTIFVPSDEEISYISSSLVRSLASEGRSIEGIVPKIIERDILEKYKR